MFEAVIALCVMAAEGPCREVLVPGYEAATAAECEEALVQRLPDPVTQEGTRIAGDPLCRPVGTVLEFEEVAEGVFAHSGLIEEPDTANLGDVTNLGFVIGEDSVAVIDTGTAAWMGEAAWRAIRARTDKPVSHVILTHMHPDHVLGAGAFGGTGAQVVAHAGLPRALADRQANYRESLERLIGTDAFLGTSIAVVDLAVEDRAEIDLGGRVLELVAWPAAHTGTDLTVLDRKTGTLFTGDLVFDLHTPALDGRLLGWRKVLEDLAAMEAARIVPGHGAASLPWPEAAEAMRRYLEVLERDTRAAIDRGERLGEAVMHIAEEERDHWHLFDAYNPRNATVAFTELEWE